MTYLEKLKQLTAWDIAPELTEDDLESTLASSALQDIVGLEPTHEEWSPTYDFNAAAAQAWLIKAARSAATVDEPTADVITSKVFDNCRKMARIYTAKRGMSVSMR